MLKLREMFKAAIPQQQITMCPKRNVEVMNERDKFDTVFRKSTVLPSCVISFSSFAIQMCLHCLCACGSSTTRYSNTRHCVLFILSTQYLKMLLFRFSVSSPMFDILVPFSIFTAILITTTHRFQRIEPTHLMNVIASIYLWNIWFLFWKNQVL